MAIRVQNPLLALTNTDDAAQPMTTSTDFTVGEYFDVLGGTNGRVDATALEGSLIQLGLVLRGDDVCGLLETIHPGVAKRSPAWIELAEFETWWTSERGETDGFELKLRSALRCHVLIHAARDALLSSWSIDTGVTTPIAVRNLYHQCCMHKDFDIDCLYELFTDLQLGDTARADAETSLARMDKNRDGVVQDHEFEVWWEKRTEPTRSSADVRLRSMLRICGILSGPNSGRTVQNVLSTGLLILNDNDLRIMIEKALDDLASHSTGRNKLADAFGQNLHLDEPHETKSIGIFDGRSKIRLLCAKICENSVFEDFILVCIAVNILALAFATPGSAGLFVSSLNFVVGILFTLEMLMRIIANGLYTGPAAYTHSGWNLFDGAVVLLMWGSYILHLSGLGNNSLSFLVTVLRSFHTIRFLSGCRQIIEAIGLGSGTLWLIVELMLVLFLVFAIMGRELLGGALSNECAGVLETDVNLMTRCPYTSLCDTCVPVLPDDGPKSRIGHVDKLGFDLISQSFLTIFSVMALDEWPMVATAFRRSSLTTSLLVWPFFAAIVFMLSLVTVNLFLATITFAYMAIRRDTNLEHGLIKAHQLLISVLAGDIQREIENVSNGANGRIADLSWTEKLVHKPCFDHFIVGIVLTNILCMAMEHHEMNLTWKSILDASELCFTLIYAFEALVKMHALGLKRYFRSGMNILDFSIVISAIFGYIVQLLSIIVDAEGGHVLRIVRAGRLFRALRAIRIGKVLFHNHAITHMASIAFSSWGAVLSLTFLIGFTLSVAAVLAMHIFAHCEVFSRINYSSFWKALLANFVVMTEDNFAQFMYEYMDCEGSVQVALYIVVLFLMVNYVMLNLYLAIFIENFQLSDEEKRNIQIETHLMELRSKDEVDMLDLRSLTTLVNMLYKGTSALKRLPHAVLGKTRKEELVETVVDDGVSCGCARPENPFRQLARRFVHNPYFHNFIEVIIVCSGICIALEGPEGAEMSSLLANALLFGDILFFVIFAMESAMMILAHGFIMAPNAYLRTQAHWFDFFVVCVTSIDMIFRIFQVDAKWMTLIRLLRVLRVLRLLEDVKSMSVMAQAIGSSLPSVAAIAGLLSASILTFGIISMQLFSGTLWFCEEDLTLDRDECKAEAKSWNNHHFHFDNIFAALGTLF
eukprot:SAG11_NODE_1827_length_4202_cov_2.276627_2_plen_1152_part_01